MSHLRAFSLRYLLSLDTIAVAPWFRLAPFNSTTTALMISLIGDSVCEVVLWAGKSQAYLRAVRELWKHEE